MLACVNAKVTFQNIPERLWLMRMDGRISDSSEHENMWRFVQELKEAGEISEALNAVLW